MTPPAPVGSSSMDDNQGHKVRPSSGTSTESKAPTPSNFLTNAELSLGLFPRTCRSLLPEKLVYAIARYIPGVNESTDQEPAEKRADACDTKDIDDHTQKELENSFAYRASTKSKTTNDSNPPLSHFQQPLSTIDDSQSMQSSEDEGSIDYKLLVKIQTPNGGWEELCALVDTGSAGNFIYPQGLDKSGRAKTPIPPRRYKLYESPILPGMIVGPQFYVRLKLHNVQVQLGNDVDLRILEVEEISDGIEIILGRKFIHDMGGTSFLARVQEASLDAPRAAISANSVAPLRVGKRSKDQATKDIARDQARREQERKTYYEIHKKFEPQPSEQSTGQSAGSQQSATTRGTSGVRPNAVLEGPQYVPPTLCDTQQSAQGDTSPLPDYGAERRMQRSETSTTRSTQYSFGRQSTASSMSSWTDAPMDASEKGVFIPAGASQDGSYSWKQ